MAAADSRRGLRRRSSLAPTVGKENAVVSEFKPIVVSAGEPAGIGPELCLKLAQTTYAPDIVVVSDPVLLETRAKSAGIDVRVTPIELGQIGVKTAGPNEILVIAQAFPAPVSCGHPDTRNAAALVASLEIAVAGCRDGRFAGMVTAPVQKSVINDAGIPFSGHTEFIAELVGASRPVMLLVAGNLRVALATTHLPLREVPDSLSQAGLREVLDVLVTDLPRHFGIFKPKIVVCGLNPHAGEGGHLGTEDADLIAPVVREFAERGHAVRGPLPADTAFTDVTGEKDAVVAMYHDQGLPVLKYASFGHAVNVTLGLPIVRTSVDHGTALNIAGTGTADPGSLIAAVKLAKQMALQ